MLVRILFSVLLIASCSMQAMEPAASSPASPSFGTFLAQAKKARYGKYAHELSYFFLHADDESNGFKTDNEPDEFRKDISNLVYKMTSVSAQSSPVFTGKFCQGGSTSDSKNKIDIFDMATFKVMHTAVLPDGSFLRTTNRDYTKLVSGGVYPAGDMYIVDVATGTVDHNITYPAYVVLARFNHGCTKLVALSADENIYVTDVATGKIEHAVANPQDNNRLRVREVNPDGTKLALAYSADKSVRVFSTITGKQLYTIPCGARESEINSIEFNHDSTILTVRCDNKTRTFDLANHRSIINTLSINESFLLKAFEQAIQSESCIHADDAQWETWESLKATLNGGYEKPDSLAVQRLTPYIMKQAVDEESLAEAE